MVSAYSVFEVSLVGGFAYFAAAQGGLVTASHIQWYWFGFLL